MCHPSLEISHSRRTPRTTPIRTRSECPRYDGHQSRSLKKMTRGRIRIAAAAALMLAVGLAAPARAQVFTGRVDVSIEDPSGGRMPGATVDLTGPIAQTQIADT